MRSSVFIVLLLWLGFAAAGPALGAAAGAKPNRGFKPPDAAETIPTDLRGPLDAPKLPAGAAVTPPSSTAPPSQGLPLPGAGLAVLAAAGLATPPAITPLRPVGDPAPICRAECAKTRYVCATTDDLECDSKWSQCVADCSAPALR